MNSATAAVCDRKLARRGKRRLGSGFVLRFALFVAIGVLPILSACVYETRAKVVGSDEGVRVDSLPNGRYDPVDDSMPLLDIAWNSDTHAYDVVETLENGGESVYSVRAVPMADGFFLLQGESINEPNRLYIARSANKSFTLYEVPDPKTEARIAAQAGVSVKSQDDEDQPPLIAGPPDKVRKFMVALAASNTLKQSAEYRLER